MTSDKGPPGAVACWDWSQNALDAGWGRRGIGRNVIFFSHSSKGLWPAAEGCSRSEGGFSGKEEVGEDSSAFFWGLSGEAQCERVFMWENINELLPTGRGAVPIISSWENTHGKNGRPKKREGEMKEDQMLLFCSHWFIAEWGFVSQRSVRKQQQKTLWFYYSDGRTYCTDTHSPPPPTEVSLSNTMTPTSTKLLTSDLWAPRVGRRMKVLPSRDMAGVAGTVFGIIMMIHIYYTMDVLIVLPFFSYYPVANSSNAAENPHVDLHDEKI